jgi:hypothetical protein
MSRPCRTALPAERSHAAPSADGSTSQMAMTASTRCQRDRAPQERAVAPSAKTAFQSGVMHVRYTVSAAESLQGRGISHQRPTVFLKGGPPPRVAAWTAWSKPARAAGVDHQRARARPALPSRVPVRRVPSLQPLPCPPPPCPPARRRQLPGPPALSTSRSRLSRRCVGSRHSHPRLDARPRGREGRRRAGFSLPAHRLFRPLPATLDVVARAPSPPRTGTQLGGLGPRI